MGSLGRKKRQSLPLLFSFQIDRRGLSELVPFPGGRAPGAQLDPRGGAFCNLAWRREATVLLEGLVMIIKCCGIWNWTPELLLVHMKHLCKTEKHIATSSGMMQPKVSV